MKYKIRPLRNQFLVGFIFLNTLIALLILSNLIPTSVIYDNLLESAEYYQENRYSYMIDNKLFSQNDSSADSNELNLMMNVDSSRPVYSALVSPFYRIFDSQDFQSTAYETIRDKTGANYNYNRYWHGYQVVWRPLMVVFNMPQIMILCLIMYLILLGVLIKSCLNRGFKDLALALSLMNLGFIVPFGFNSLQYIPVFYVMILASILLVRDKLNSSTVLLCSGVLVAFTDFLTAETLALTVPLVCLAYLRNKEFNLKILEFVKVSLYWLIGYCFTFIYKWGLASVIYKENYFKIALEKYQSHDNPSFEFAFGLKYNLNVLFGNMFSFNGLLICFIFLVILSFIVIYLFRRKDSSMKYVCCLYLISCIPYIRYLVLSGHSAGYIWFTYRAQLVLIATAVLLVSQLIPKKKGGRR